MSAPLLRVISLGAGVQSTCLALMAARGDIGPMPDCAIFADTGWEPAEVYEHLAWLETVLPFPVYRVRREGRDLGETSVAAAIGGLPRKGTSLPPWFLAWPEGRLPKQCSKEFKTRAIQRKICEMLGIEPGKRGPRRVVVEQWIGISADEADRAKPSEKKYIANRWPLLELRMKRRDCLTWMAERQYPRPPKSSCIFCPFRSDSQWRDMRDNHPGDWAKAVEFDAAIRPGFHGMKGQAFVHRQRVPLDQVDLRTAADRGQEEMFSEECEGVCGV